MRYSNALLGAKSVFAIFISLNVASANADFYSARNTGMGGTGIASSHYDTASLYNPALLTNTEEHDSFSLIIPSVGVLASDQDDVIDTLSDLTDDFDLLDVQIINTDPQAIATRNRVIEGLRDASDKPITVDVSTALVLAVPLDDVAFAIDVRGKADIAVLAHFDEADIALIDGAIASSTTLDNVNLSSSAKTVGAVLTEVVFSFAKRFDFGGHDISLAIAPKYQNIETILYVQDADDFDSDDFDADEFTQDESNVNLDLGAAWYISENLIVGATLKNLVNEKYKTVVSTVSGESDTYEVATEFSAGVAYKKRWYTVAADIDLLPRKSFSSLDDTQFVSAGIELDAANWVQLRLGVKVDLKSTKEDIATVGIGLSPFDVFHLGITGMAGSNDTYGAVVEIKLTI